MVLGPILGALGRAAPMVGAAAREMIKRGAMPASGKVVTETVKRAAPKAAAKATKPVTKISQGAANKVQRQIDKANAASQRGKDLAQKTKQTLGYKRIEGTAPGKQVTGPTMRERVGKVAGATVTAAGVASAVPAAMSMSRSSAAPAKPAAKAAPAKPAAKAAPAAKDASSKQVATKGGNYPVYAKKSGEAQDFRSAFAAARKSGKKEFTWQGRRYTTEMKK